MTAPALLRRGGTVTDRYCIPILEPQRNHRGIPMPKSKVRPKAKKKAAKARTDKQADSSTCRNSCCPPPAQDRPRP